MANEGILVFTDAQQQEHRIEVTGDLDFYPESDGAGHVEGVVNVGKDAVGPIRDALERQAGAEAAASEPEPGAHFTGEVTDAEGGKSRPLVDVPMVILDVYDNGNVRLRSVPPTE